MAVRRLPNGKWLARVFLDYGGPKGRRRDTSMVFDGELDAKAWEVAQAKQKKKGEATPRTRETIRQYLESWLDCGLTGRNIRERTWDGYAWLVRRYILPNVPAVRLDQFGTRHVRTLAATLLKQRVARGKTPKAGEEDQRPMLSRTTVKDALRALSVAMSDAVEEGLIGENPLKRMAKRIRLPQGDPKEVPWLGREELRALIDSGRDDPLTPLWGLLAYSGLRPGEGLGLLWENCDLEGGVIRVEWSLTPGKGSAEPTLTRPKTHRSRRTVPIPGEAVALLEAHRRRQEIERIVAGSKWVDRGFVFCGPMGEPLRHDGLARRLAKACKRAKVPVVSPYGLRHGHASLLLEAGVPLVSVSRRLGHSTISLTADTYTHERDETQVRAAEQFGAFMAPKGLT